MVEAIRQGDIPGIQLRRRREIPVPLEEAWPWLAEPEKLGRWLAQEAEIVGWDLRLITEDGREYGETLEKAEPRCWVFAFQREDAGWGRAATRLSLRLHRAFGGTEVDLFHEGFHRLPSGLCLPVWEDYRQRWEDSLRRLGDAVAGKDIPEPVLEAPVEVPIVEIGEISPSVGLDLGER